MGQLWGVHVRILGSLSISLRIVFVGRAVLACCYLASGVYNDCVLNIGHSTTMSGISDLYYECAARAV